MSVHEVFPRIHEHRTPQPVIYLSGIVTSNVAMGMSPRSSLISQPQLLIRGSV